MSGSVKSKARECTRFKPGQSGNPRGRPRKNPDGDLDPVERVCALMVPFNVNGVAKRIPLGDAVAMQVAKAALSGDKVAARELFKAHHQRRKHQRLKRRIIEDGSLTIGQLIAVPQVPALLLVEHELVKLRVVSRNKKGELVLHPSLVTMIEDGDFPSDILEESTLRLYISRAPERDFDPDEPYPQSILEVIGLGGHDWA